MASRTLNSPALPEGRVQSDMREMRQPFAVSAAFHLGLLLFAIFGLHLFPKKDMEIPTPISISMVKPSDIARTTHVDDAHEEKEPTEPLQSKAPEPPKESQSSAPPPLPPIEQPVQQTPPPPSKPAEPTPPPEPMAKPLPKLTPMQQAQSSFQQPAQLPPLQKPRPVTKPAPQPPKPQQKIKQTDPDFQSLLTSLTPPVPKADQISKDKPAKSHAPSAARANLADQMTADEMGVVRERLKACWIVPIGAENAKNLNIDIQAHYNEDKTLVSETLVDENNRYNSDSFYRAAADSALRALRNPQCNPLPWPDGKYAAWGSSSIRFNPELLGN